MRNNRILKNAGTGTFCGDTNELVAPSVSDSDPHESALILVGWIRIQEGKEDPQK